MILYLVKLKQINKKVKKNNNHHNNHHNNNHNNNNHNHNNYKYKKHKTIHIIKRKKSQNQEINRSCSQVK